MYENEKIQKWIEEHDEEDYCNYCKWNGECGRSGVRGGPNGLIYPPCADEDINELLDEDFNQEGKWIPCSEGMPNDAETVLCTDGMYIYITEYDADMDAPFGDMDNIIAWQQLPKPYKEGEE